MATTMPPLRIPAAASRRRRGVILVMVLWIVVIMALLSYSMLFQVSIETSVTIARKKQLQAEALARAGVAKAIVDLRNDLYYDNMEEGKVFDAEGDFWKRPEEHGGLNRGGRDKDKITLGRSSETDGYFSVRVYDEDRLININRIGAAAQQLLRTIIENIGYNEEDAELVACAIIDWRDGDSQPALANAPDSNEGLAYAMIRAEEEGGRRTDAEDLDPVVLRNENYLTVDELLEVYGVTPDLYFGPGTPEARYFNRELERKTGRQSRNERFQVDTSKRRRSDVVYGLRDYFTTMSLGPLNINTAPEHVLDALAIASGAGDEGWGETVLKVRRGSRAEDITNKDAFKEMTEVMANGEVGSVVGVARTLHPIGVNSDVFRIISYGVVGDVKSRLEVVVLRRLPPLNVDEAFEHPERAEPFLDRMKDRFDRRIDKNDNVVVKYPFVRIIQMVKD